jgi:hypothetical protein
MSDPKSRGQLREISYKLRYNMSDLAKQSARTRRTLTRYQDSSFESKTNLTMSVGLDFSDPSILS